VGNDGHVPNVLRVVHESTDLSAQSVIHPSIIASIDVVRGDVCAVRTSSTVKLPYC
jgi:hypothetical protein